MNRTELQRGVQEADNMGDDQLRAEIAVIAEHGICIQTIVRPYSEWKFSMDGAIIAFEDLPDYVGSLEVMRQLEGTLMFAAKREGRGRMFDYTRALQCVVRTRERALPMLIDDWEMLHAAARQRAEAFYAVHGSRIGSCTQYSMDKG